MKLLHIDSSILGEGSVSRQVSSAIASRVRTDNPGTETVYRDLAADPIPHLTQADWPFANPDAPLDDVREFLNADVIVIGAPMYNFTIPSQLKAWLDRILVKGETFRYSETGPEALAGGRRVIIAISRGGIYGAGTPMAAFEHLESYLRGVFSFIGIEPEFVVAEGVNYGPDQRSAAIDQALGTVSALAA